MNELTVFASPLPFSNHRIKFVAAPGSTVKDIIDLICPARYHRAGIGAIVSIAGHEVFPEKWHCIKPKPGMTINVRIVPMGGGGKKNPIASLLSIAVLIAAPYVGAVLAAGVGVTSAVGVAAITAGVGVVGKLLVSAIAPPPKPSNYGSGGNGNPNESPTQFIEGATNSINRYGVIPICLGTNRMFPLQAALPFTETQNNDQYVRQLFTYGYGENLVIDDLRIGETAISQFSDFELEHRLEGDLHEPTGLYSNDVFQNDYNVLLQAADDYTLRTTQAGVDEAIVDVTFPQGLSEFNSNGTRLSRRVQLEVQYAPTGTDNWSAGVFSFKGFTGSVLTVQPNPLMSVKEVFAVTRANVYRRDLVVVDGYTGVASIVQGAPVAQYSKRATAPILPANKIRLATLLVHGTPDGFNSVISVSDDSAPTQGFSLQNLDSFIVSVSGMTVTIGNGGLSANQLDVTASQTEALRKSVRIVFPETGTYDIRIRRLSLDTASDQIFDKSYLTAIKSVTHRAPVRLTGLCGTAARIRATDQLNGTIDQFNALVSNVIPDYDAATGLWTPAVTSNPASIYRYVLQGNANAKPLPDSKLDLAAIEDWHTHCAEQGYTYNRVIDYETSVDATLRDVAAAGAASPAIVDGKRTVVIDRIKDDIVQVVTPRNSWGYSGEMIYPNIPHAFRVQFRNAEKGYQQDERIVYDDGYDEDSATEFEGLELQSCTNSALAFKTARRHIASARLRPESHSFMMDVENLVALRGDRVVLVHDVPIVGIGDGRIKTVETSGGNVTGFTIDDTVSVPDTAPYSVRIRLGDGTQIYQPVQTVVGDQSAFFFISPFPVADAPAPGDLCAFYETGDQLDLVITRIEPQDDLTARITAVDYAPAVFVAENVSIPPFTSRITTPLALQRPLPPVLLNAQSDESVMLRNSDGTYTPRAIFTLRNDNEGPTTLEVKIRRVGSSVFAGANILESSAERLILTGLDDGSAYDIHLRYRRAGASMLSLPLQLNGYVFVGVTGLPDAVTGFLMTVAGQTALFKWDANDDIDLSHYRIKFSSLFTGATWGTAQILEDRIYENRLSVGFQAGTYLIKAVDRLGNESESATAIITYDPGAITNAVEFIEEHPAFIGLKDNVTLYGNSILLADTDSGTGYYYFDYPVDLTGVFTSFVSASILANGTFVNNIFDMDDIFAEADIFGAGSNDLFTEADIFSMGDVFGIGVDGWSVQLQYRTTSDDPADAPAWSAWTEFTAGNIEFWGIEFRLHLNSLAKNVSPQVTGLSVTIDMPDRVERGDDMVVLPTGATVEYDQDFIGNPAVVITIQNGDANDEIEFTEKDTGGFSFKVYNTSATAYVARTYDFIASGYGRKRA